MRRKNTEELLKESPDIVIYEDMDERTKFLIFCIERYRYHKDLPGWATIDLFNKSGLTYYIIDHYPALHLTGDLYNVGDFDIFLQNRGYEVKDNIEHPDYKSKREGRYDD